MTTWALASRGSALALRQAEIVCAALAEARPGLEIRVDVVRTTGDRRQDVALARIGATGIFTKEVDACVLDGRARLAVHSLKDVPTEPPPGLRIAAVLARHDARDAWVPAPGVAKSLDAVEPGARVGTSSLRRRALLLAARPDLVLEDLRGNLDTRLARVHVGDYDGIVVAMAGLRRLGMEPAAEPLGPPHWLPAAGQGALAVVVAADDDEAATAVGLLDHADTRTAVTAERALLRRLQGGCQIPIGAFASIEGGILELAAVVSDLGGRRVIRGSRSAEPERAEAAGVALAEELIGRGADEIVREIREATGGTVPGAGAP